MSNGKPDQAGILQRMNQLAMQFVQRTLTELSPLQQLLQRIQQGDTAAIRELELLAHKIHGTGATFGLGGISGCAGEIEHAVAHAQLADFDAQRIESINRSIERLRTELDLELAARKAKESTHSA